MTEETLIAAAHHMAGSQDKLVEQFLTILGRSEALKEQLRMFEEFLDARDKLIMSQVTLKPTIMDQLGNLVDVLRKHTASLNENTARLNESMRKMESYFGSGEGLKHEN